MSVYEKFDKAYPSANGQLNFDNTQTTLTLKAAKSASHTIFVRRIIVYINTDAAQSITFQDSNASPVVIAKVTTSPGADTRWDFDYGERGFGLTQGKDLKAVFSAAGLAGKIVFYGYQKV
jgi:hypothetical protein